MLSGLRGLAQSAVRGAVRIGMKIQETTTALKEWGLGYLESEMAIDFEKFDRQKFIRGEVAIQNQDQLIPGSLHEESVWKLKSKFRYEIATPWETAKGEVITSHTVITSEERLTPNEVFEAAADHPSMYAPEAAVFRGEMEIEGVWFR